MLLAGAVSIALLLVEPELVESSELDVDVDVDVDVEVDVDVDVLDVEVPVVVEPLDASVAELLTPATRPTVVTPATAAAVQPAIFVRRSRRLGFGSEGCCPFMTATIGFAGSGPHHGNVKTVLSPAGNQSGVAQQEGDEGTAGGRTTDLK